MTTEGRRAEIAIVGQGLAGTLLGLELERQGADFQVYDSGPAGSGSAVAAGIINPVTGRRLAPSWRIAELLPLARETYRGIERRLGVPLWRDLRVRRWFRDERERRIFAERREGGELAPWLGAVEADGFWTEGAGHVNVPALLGAARHRWLERGVLTARAVEPGELRTRHGLVILCQGAALASSPVFAGVPWRVVGGELLTVEVPGLDESVILNRGTWVLPLGGGLAEVGATYLPEATAARSTAAGRARLEADARELLGRTFAVRDHRAGLRLTLPDQRPAAGRDPRDHGWGVLAGLGSKGASLAPWLARQWWNHLSEGVPFDPEVDVARFLSAGPAPPGMSRIA
jgi:glycine oxidase